MNPDYHNLQNKRGSDSPGAGATSTNVNGNAYDPSGGALAPNERVAQRKTAVKNPRDAVPKHESERRESGGLKSTIPACGISEAKMQEPDTL